MAGLHRGVVAGAWDDHAISPMIPPSVSLTLSRPVIESASRSTLTLARVLVIAAALVTRIRVEIALTYPRIFGTILPSLVPQASSSGPTRPGVVTTGVAINIVSHALTDFVGIKATAIAFAKKRASMVAAAKLRRIHCESRARRSDSEKSRYQRTHQKNSTHNVSPYAH